MNYILVNRRYEFYPYGKFVDKNQNFTLVLYTQFKQELIQLNFSDSVNLQDHITNRKFSLFFIF